MEWIRSMRKEAKVKHVFTEASSSAQLAAVSADRVTDTGSAHPHPNLSEAVDADTSGSD